MPFPPSDAVSAQTSAPDSVRGTSAPAVEPAPASGRVRSGKNGAPGFSAAGGASVRPAPQTWRRRAAYLALDVLNRVVPKDPDKVVLHSTIDIEDGVLALVEELRARGRTAIVLLEQPGRAAMVRRHAGGEVRTVPKKSVRGMLHYLTARVAVTTENLYGDRPPPPSQVVVNIWHGDPPAGKVIGQFFPGVGGLHCTYAPVLSTLGRAFRCAEFGLRPIDVPVIGAARNDRMLRADAAEVRHGLLGEDADRPTYLWLPSFRSGSWAGRTRVDVANAHPGVPFPASDVRRLDDWLVERGARLVVKLHPHDLAAFSGEFRAIRVLGQQEMEAQGLTVYTLLPAFDGLLTDMSSVWVDYLLLDKPLVFAFPDVQDYRDGRGLTVEPYEHWVPGAFVRDMDELILALSDLVDGRDPTADERAVARLRFHQHLDDRSAARLLDGVGLPPR
jgi:CDP-glycerol glycerophosphotransferase